MEICEGVHRVDGASQNWANANVYLETNGRDLTVVDTGTPGNAKKICEYIEKLGFKPTDVSTIIITHYHMDHAGSACELKRLTNAKVAVHEDDAGYVAGTKPYPKSAERLLLGFLSIFIRLKHVSPDVILHDDDMIAGLRVLHAPGHSPGSIALLDEKRRVLFVGDTMRFKDGQVTGPEPGLTLDMGKAVQSIHRLSSIDFDVMLSGHSEPLRSHASDAVKKLAELLR